MKSETKEFRLKYLLKTITSVGCGGKTMLFRGSFLVLSVQLLLALAFISLPNDLWSQEDAATEVTDEEAEESDAEESDAEDSDAEEDAVELGKVVVTGS
ncbi:MAG TPA: hypothetical protein VJN01_09315, partial [Xanthomonadales bacterium]|nr:hypothetical protein [Xanthomonadales bacterium]